MCSVITYRSTRSSTKALIRSGIMGSASSPSALCLNVTHQGANSASSPLPLRMMRPGSAASFQLPDTCRTTASEKVAGRGERSTQEFSVCHLQRAGALWAQLAAPRLAPAAWEAPKGPKRTQKDPNPLQAARLALAPSPALAMPSPTAQPHLADSLIPSCTLSWAACWPRQFVFLLAEMPSKRKLLSQGGNSARAAHCINRTWPRVIYF